ncbi:MAG: CPBP family intramembrane metalloprotease [Micropruina sp.]|nr:CPBP family intramembrane metalloprotease [Micropruina sp.]
MTIAPSKAETLTRRSVTLFTLVTLAGAWLVCLPLWGGDGLNSDLALPAMTAMMFLPSLGALISLRVIEKEQHPWQALRVPIVGSVGRFILIMLGTWVVVIGLIVAALLLGDWIGVYQLDLDALTGLREALEPQLRAAGQSMDGLALPGWALLALLLPGLVLGSVVSSLAALGEELGWRGYLFPRLALDGRTLALGVSGLLWGLWHAPLLLLGYNYGEIPSWQSIALMTGFCTVIGALLSWVTETVGTIWPAALAHGTINSTLGPLALFLGPAGAKIDVTQATLLGWTGWIVPAILALILWVWRTPRQPAEPARPGPQ